MGAEHEEPQHLQVILLTDLPHCTEVAQGFAHLPVINVQEGVVQPVVGKFFAVSRLALGDLIFMMGEDQVFAAGVDVDLFAQIFPGHYGTLNMPAGTAVTPGRLPGRLSLFLWLPQHEIQGIFLLVLAGHQERALAGAQVIQVLVGQLPILLELAGAEVNGSVLLIGIALVDQSLYHLHHAADLLGGQGMGGGRLYIHALHILLALPDVPLGDLLGGYSFLNGFVDDLVVHVSKVGHVVHIVSLVLKIPAHRIKHDHRPCVPDMDEIIDRGPADIHFHLPRLQGDEFLFSLSQCVIQLHLLLFPPHLRS